MVQCIDCQQRTRKAHPKDSSDPRSIKSAVQIVEAGFVRCLIGPAWQFNNPRAERHCTSWRPRTPGATHEQSHPDIQPTQPTA